MPHANPDTYFDRFPGFEPDPRQPLQEEFNRLARFQKWNYRSKRFVREREEFLRVHFDLHLGAVDRSKKLEDWQSLCRELRIDPIPGSIKQCKIVLSTKVHVNLIDLMDSRRLGTEVKIFKTRKQLVKYTRSSENFFPKDEAKEKGLIKILLRQIL